MKKKKKNRQDKGPSGVGIFISLTFSMCPLSKNEWSLKKFLFE